MIDSADQTDKKIDIQWKKSAPKRQKLGKSGLDAGIVEEDNTTEYVFAIENSKIDNGLIVEVPKGPLIIPVAASFRTNEESVSEKISDQPTISKKRPLLLANTSEAFLSAKTEDERYKIGVESCAEDLDVRSSAYTAVPIEEFGAALLRGMGWDGKIDEKDRRVSASQGNRLGLGGAPSIFGKQSNKNKAAEVAKKQALFNPSGIIDGSIVSINDPASIAYRAKVVKTQGIPGLSRIRVAKEHDGEIIDINKSFAKLLSSEELETNPFEMNVEKMKEIDEMIRGSDQTVFHGLKTQPLQPTASTNNTSNPSNNPGVTSQITGASTEKILPPPKVGWLRGGIRVKLISDKVAGKQHYLQKGTVLDAHSKGIGSVTLDNGTVLDAVKEKYLETVLPAVGGACMILLGEYAGDTATLLEKDSKHNKAVIQMTESLEVIQVEMDDIAASIRT